MTLSHVPELSYEDQRRACMAEAKNGVYCIPCGKVLSKNCFNRHFRDHHYSDSSKYSCPKCHKIYKNRSTMLDHILKMANHQDLKGVKLDLFKIPAQ